MAKRCVTFNFTSEIMTEPIIYNLGQQFNTVTNILRADVRENRGYIVLELDGEEEDIEAGIAWAISRGVRVDPANEETI
ncbi:NIL domain-containing protein [Chloroflexota bacterium]